MFKKMLFVICVALLLASMAQAQYKKMGRVVGLSGGTAILNEESENIRYGGTVHLSYAYPIIDRLQGEVRAGYSYVKAGDDFAKVLVPVDWRLRWSFFPLKEFYPYLFAGAGAIFYSGHNAVYFPYGGGIEIPLKKCITLDIQGAMNYTQAKASNRIYDEDNEDWQTYTVGLRVPLNCFTSKCCKQPDKKPVAEKPVIKPAPEIGKPINLEGIVFKTGSAEILPEAEPTLISAFETLRDNPTIDVEISGHTDNTGAHDMNVKLSQDRADAVKNWLVNRGIIANRITAKGYGPDRPTASNDTAEGRQLNRRIEFVRTK